MCLSEARKVPFDFAFAPGRIENRVIRPAGDFCEHAGELANSRLYPRSQVEDRARLQFRIKCGNDAPA
jgi:hypothetical protein